MMSGGSCARSSVRSCEALWHTNGNLVVPASGLSDQVLWESVVCDTRNRTRDVEATRDRIEGPIGEHHLVVADQV